MNPFQKHFEYSSDAVNINAGDVAVYAIPGLDESKPQHVVERVVCRVFNIEPKLLHLKTRKREIVEARQVAMHFIAKYSRLTYSCIGAYFGNYDHSTIVHAIKMVKNLSFSDRMYARNVRIIDNELKEILVENDERHKQKRKR